MDRRWVIAVCLVALTDAVLFVGTNPWPRRGQRGLVSRDAELEDESPLARGRRLDLEMQAVNECLRIQDELAEALVAERLTLAQAVRQLRPFLPPGHAEWLRLGELELGNSDDERLGRLLIRCARAWTEDRGDNGETLRATLDRLEAELTDQLRPDSDEPGHS
jgi:hypothetical protein